MNTQHKETKHMTIQRRVLTRKCSWLVGITITVVAGLFSTTVINQQHAFEEDKLVTTANVTSKQTTLINNYAQLPLQFEQNLGQTNDEVEFISRGSGYTLFLTPTETLLTLQRFGEEQVTRAVVRTTFVNANVPVEFNGNNALLGNVNYLIGRDEIDWVTNIPTYADVIAKEIYPGIDLRYHGDQRQLEYDFIVAPGANTNDIKLQFSGVELLTIGDEGQLVIETEHGALQHKKPIVYQDINGKRIDIEGEYLIASNNIVSFKLGEYDLNYKLVIDPILDYSTYFGGEGNDKGLAIAVDDAGNAYIAGTTASASFPVVNGYQTSLNGSKDTFIVKLNADGDALVYATYFGGSGDEDDDDDDDSDDEVGEDDEDDNDEGDSDNDTGKDIVVDVNGNLYITGSTNSDVDFPIINAVQSTYGGGDRDAYIAKLSADGSSLLFSTYLGGSNKDKGFGIALSDTGDVFVTGRTKSNNFPTTVNGYQTSHAGNGDAYIVQLTSDGSQINYATYFGGSKSDVAKAIAIDSLGNATITGVTKSKNDFPLSNALQPSFGGGGRDAFVSQLNTSGSALNYSTYLGGAKKDKGRGITIDSQNNAIVVGMTKSKNDFPLVNPLQSNYGGGSDDGFISKLTADGSALSFSTYLGGEKTDKIRSVAVDSNDNIYIVGTTKSTTGIPTIEAIQDQLSGSKRDAFITKLSSDGNTVIYSTYLGGFENDRGRDIAVDEQAAAYITGVTKSDIDFPILNALQPLFGGGNKDAFVIKISEETTNQDPVITSTPVTDALVGQLYTYDVDATDPDNDALIYGLQVFPTGMVIDNNTGVITWTPTTVGNANVTVLVDDNNSGTETQSFIITVSDPDVTAPTITITSPADGLIINQSNQTITGSLNETATLTLNGNPVTVNPDLSFSIAVTLVEGANSYTFEATDAATNVGTQALTLNLDTVLPVITVTSPQDGLISNQITQTITGSLSETATLTINGQAVTVNPDLTFSSDVTLVEGANVISIDATDTATNVGTASLTLTLDTVIPVITITTPQDGLTTNQPIQTITGSLSETAKLTINGQTVTVNPDLTFSSDVTLIEGVNTITIEAVDEAANIGTSLLILNLDTVAPVITVAAPQDGLITNQTAQTITGSLSETAILTINGQAITVNQDNSYSFAVTLSEGQNTFAIEATDTATNVGTASLTLNLDTVAPVTTITTPINGLLTNNPTQLVTGSVSETSTLTINGQVVTVNSGNSFSFGPITLSEGANTITAIATDAASNSSTTTVNVSVDTIAPVISVTSPVDGTLINQNQITVVGSLSELGNLSINGQAVSVNLDGSFSATVSLVEGANTITLTASDAAANVSQTQLTVTSDTIAPVISVTTPVNGSTTNQAAQFITGTLSEAATLTINSQLVTVNPDLSFSFGPITLIEGVNSINLSATDAATNNSVELVSVTLDTVAPSLTLDSPTGDILTNQSVVSFSGSVNETVSLTINGQAVTQNPDNTFAANVTVAEGANVVDVIATDAGGNTATQSINVTIDTTPPTSPIISLINRGNPLNGIVMVTGLAGAAEAGTLIHVINPTNSYETLVLAQSDGSFSTDVSGFANDSFTIFTVDAAGNTSAPAVLIPNPPLALTLDTIGNKTAPLGQITRFTVTANDNAGNPITLGLTPVPLPASMNYNIATGEFSFRPTSGQEGDYNLTFSALSGDERVVETLTVTVPAPNPTDPTDLTGRILDASSMQGGTIEPIVGATVSFIGTGVSTTTDIDGYFTLSGLPVGADVFDIDTSTAQAAPSGASYAGFREQFPLVVNVANVVERPFYLPRLASESLTTVDPLVETIVNNPTLGIDLSIAAGNAINDSDGQPFTGQISISEVPRNLAPANLPEFMDPTLLFTIQPVGVSYTVPAPITIANTEGHAPNSEVDLWSVDPDLGQFVIVGVGQVSADGTEIVTISGGIRANDWHSFQPPNPNSGGSPSNGRRPCPTCPEEILTSTVSLNDGHMGTRHTLPAYRSLETSRALTFSYRTFRAFPRPSIPYNSAIDVRSTVPATVSYELEVGGLKQGQEVFIDTSGFSEGLTEGFSTAISFDATEFDSGMYDYRLKVTSNFNGGSRQSLIIEDVIMVVNEQQSPFGAGWMLEGLYSLGFNEDDSVTLIAPNGNSISYDVTATPDLFDSPDSDYAIFNRNPDGSYTHTEKDGVKMHFDATGLITEHEDRNNNITAYAYDVDGKIITITDPVGLITTFAYDINGLLQTVTDPASRVSTFEYDATGNMTRVTYPDNTFETYEYDDRHLMTAHEDERQNRFTDRYDTFGRIIDGTLPDGTVRAGIGQNSAALIDVSSGVGTSDNPAPVMRPAEADGEYVDGRGNPSNKELDRQGRATLEMDEIGRITTHVRDTDSNPTQTTRPIGSVVTRSFDNFGNVLTQKEEFNTATTTYVYDAFSLVTTVTNPRSHTTTINRDPIDGNPLSIVNHLGHTTTMIYDSRGLVTSMTSPNGLVTTYTYNTEGLMDSKTETPPVSSPGNVRVWSYTYFSTGLLQTVNTPDGITLNYTYDNRSFLTSVTDNLNQSIVYTYDNHKNVTRTETRSNDGSLALLVDSIYDNRNRLTETRAPHVGVEESITQRILDENSNLTGLIDPNGNPSSNVYDAFNRLDNNTHREGGITDYTYDDQDRIIKVTAPNGVTTDYEYDIISRRTKEISPDRGTISYTYDLANNVTTITEGRGIVASMSYDNLERVATKVYPNTIIGKNENVTYTYDTCSFGLGYLCTRVDESGSTDYDYDAYGNQTDSDFTEIEGTLYTMNYQYDDGDHIIQMTMPSGRVVDYSRDGVRRVTGIDTTLNGAAQNIVSNIQYRGDNQMLSCDYGNGLSDTRGYDLQGRLTNQLLEDAINTLIDQRTYSYDKNSNVTNIDTNLEDNGYLYDKLDRLTSDTIDTDVPIEFSYDLNDNRLSKTLQDASFDELLTYVANSNRVLETDGFQIGATPLTAIPNRDLVFNDVGRLFQLIEEGTLKAEYVYNDSGQRTRKTIYQTDGITVDSITIYHYDQMGYLVTETTETGQLIKDYIWQEGMTPVAQIDNNAGTESIVYLYTDHLMTNRLATDEFQSVVWRWEGEAFGNTAAQELAGVSVNLRFPGQYYDQETNLHYNYFRYYDPQLGRYITSDPIGLDGGINTYLYANANAIRLFDPFGLIFTSLHALTKGVSTQDAVQIGAAGTASLGTGAAAAVVTGTAGAGGVGFFKIPKVLRALNPLIQALLRGLDDGALPPPKPPEYIPPPPPQISTPYVPGVRPVIPGYKPHSNLSPAIDSKDQNLFCILNPDALNCKPSSECL